MVAAASRKAACVDAARCCRAAANGVVRRSDQSSRRMFGRRVTLPVGQGVVAQGQNSVRGPRQRTEDARGRTGEALRRARRHVNTLVAIDRHGSLRWAARHVACHLVRHARCRHVSLGQHRVGAGRRHHRAGHRGPSKARDHQDRQQPPNGGFTGHKARFPRSAGNGKLTILILITIQPAAGSPSQTA